MSEQVTEFPVPYRLGVDVGGTFTDLLLIDHASGSSFRAKVPSTPADQSQGVLAGIESVCRLAGIGASAIDDLMHGTTVATNAVLEGKGARVGLIVTSGYRQVLHIGRSLVPGGLAGWIIWQQQDPLASLEDTVEVEERVGADGSVVRPLDEVQAHAAVRALAARGVEAITISLMNSFANPAHEHRLRAIAQAALPGIPVSLSSDILPEMREYERTLTTVANAYVRPVVGRYLGNLAGECSRRGVSARLRVLRSDGGLMGFDTAIDKPVNLLMSGPAGGVAGALWAGGHAGFGNLLTFDMGGTSTDVALIEAGAPRLRRETAVGDVTVRASSLDVRTVGAGGGSIARVPALTKALRVGPESAGAVPGPAAYGKGGTTATVTDANVVLGYLPADLLGGAMTLDRDAARGAVQAVADELGVGLEAAAQGIVAIVNENMFGALRLVSAEQGYDPRDFALIAFGGAGPLHGNALGALLGSWPVIIPPSPGVLCAFGDATTRVRNEAARTFVRRVSATTADEVAAALRALAVQAAASLDAQNVPRSEQTAVFQVDVRYYGQGFELTVDVEPDGFSLDRLGGDFDAAHVRLFTFALPAEREIVNLRAVVQGAAPFVAAPSLPHGSADPAAARTGVTQVSVQGAWQQAGLYDRAGLQAGNRIQGPAIVTEMDSTSLVLPGHIAVQHEGGSLLIWPERHQALETAA